MTDRAALYVPPWSLPCGAYPGVNLSDQSLCWFVRPRESWRVQATPPMQSVNDKRTLYVGA